MFDSIESVEKVMISQAKTTKAKNLLKEVISKCKRDNKTPKETFSEINQLIVGSIGVC
jgi:hypothetical protein